MNGEAMTLFDALAVLGFFVLLTALCSAGYWVLYRAGWLADPDASPYEDSPGWRTDRQRLLEDEIR